jgi:nucleotide-binding universal stress UspA family protein
MKTILIPAEDHDSMPAVLEAARIIAKTFDSYMEGFAARPSPAAYVSVDPVSSLAISGAFDVDTTREVKAQFEAFMQSHDVPHASGDATTYSWAWPREDAMDDLFIGSRGRVFDLIVVGRPGGAPQNPRMIPLEAALFDSGRPVLVVPPMAPTTIGRNILVSWNGSTEQARSNAFAKPLLRLAEAVTVLTVEGGSVAGPSCEEAAAHLRRNGIKATAKIVQAGQRTPGEAILDYAAANGCDLLVKGAYTQSRLRQLIFGGATRHILVHGNLPVLMAH